VSVAINQCSQTEDFLLLGELLGKAIADVDRRVVVLASGGMTHRFFPFRELRQHESSAAPENILGLESYEADQRVVRMLQSGDHRGVIDGMPEYRKAAPEGHFGHYLIMAGAIGGARCQAPGELFSEYEASVGTGQVHVWFERPADGWTG
jgi:aromatic ring-opening dioxygenase catalytic subunit (LigB family)